MVIEFRHENVEYYIFVLCDRRLSGYSIEYLPETNPVREFSQRHLSLYPVLLKDPDLVYE